MSSLQPSIELSLTDGGADRTFQFDDGPIVVGRQSGCTVTLVEPDISRRHAQLDRADGQWMVTNLSSHGQTFVNDEQVTQKTLQKGDELRLGKKCVLHCNILAEAPTTDVVDDLDDVEFTVDGTIDAANFGGLLREVTDQPLVESAGGRSYSWVLDLVRNATDTLLTYEDLHPTLGKVLELLFAHLPAQRGMLMLYHADEDRLERAAQHSVEGDSQIQLSRSIAERVLTTKQAILIKDAVHDEDFAEAQSIVASGVRSAMCAPLCHKDGVVGLVYVDRFSADKIFQSTDLEVLTVLASLSASAVERARLRDAERKVRDQRERLARYHPGPVVEHILQRQDPGESLPSEERDVSVLFFDIAGFTRMSENLAALQVTALLNDIFGRLTDEVFKEDGTLNKFLGDGMMVSFGAPLDQPDHAIRAVRVGLAIQKRMIEYNEERATEKPLQVRIGINSGIAVAGDIGSVRHREYTLIGDTVNTASRLESTIASAGQVVIGVPTWEHVKDQFEFEALEPKEVKGKAKPLQAYNVLGPKA